MAFDGEPDLGPLVESGARLAPDHLIRRLTNMITILSPNLPAIQAITNLRPYAGQSFSHELSNTLTQNFIPFQTGQS